MLRLTRRRGTLTSVKSFAVVAVVAFVLVSATTAGAAAPAGFSSSPRLAPAASFVAGKPVAVYCANTEYDWKQFLETTGRTGSDANGSAVPGSSEVKLSPSLCTNLRLQLAGKTVRNVALGPSILALVHESIHDRGEANEGATDCAAVHEMARVAVKFFHVKAGKQLRAVMAATWTYRAGESAPYRTVC